MQKEGCSVLHAVDGEQTMHLLEENIDDERPDIILLDLVLPAKSGFDILADIKADQKIADIPVVVLSNLGQDADNKRAMDGGAADYMIKSNFTIPEIVQKIITIVGENRAQNNTPTQTADVPETAPPTAVLPAE